MKIKNMVANTKLKIAVGLSGGVDSSVAAYVLKKAGHELTGVFMQCWDARADGCKSDEDKAYAVETAAVLGIEFVHLDFRSEYKSTVMDYFYREYQAGRTPNPDVMCNKEIKFGLFFDWAMKNGFDDIATGHYARILEQTDSSSDLMKGADATKDQSYFLYLLDQKTLSKTLFPVGNLRKKQVRDIALKNNLPAAVRAESMGICFIGEVSIKEFLKKTIKPSSGVVLDTNGQKIGSHDGAWFYTIGQRHGFKVEKYTGTPMYVVSKDVGRNVLVVAQEAEVYTSEFSVSNLHWINKAPELLDKFECQVRIRHLGKMHDCTIMQTQSKNTSEQNLIKVVVIKPIFAVAPGQSAVFYLKDIVLGGGIIT